MVTGATCTRWLLPAEGWQRGAGWETKGHMTEGSTAPFLTCVPARMRTPRGKARVSTHMGLLLFASAVLFLT